jgi:two-component system, OmpR family, sensor histidine kinase BaeS
MMFRSLRNRLLFSHIIPLIVIIPMMGIGLAYVLETQVLLPRLAENMVSDARLLTEISRAEYDLWGNPVLFGNMLSRTQLNPSLRVMFLTPDGHLLYSTDPTDLEYLGQGLDISGLDLARSGNEVVLTNYSGGLRLHNVVLDVLSPVVSSDGPVLGIVRVTYHIESVYELFSQMRYLIILILGGGLLLGAGIGLGLALSINRPVQNVTAALYDIASGTRSEPLPERGPTELREQARAVNHLVARLRTLEQARRQLLANLVHELGRPLGALRSAIHALSKGAAQDPQLLNDLIVGMDEETIRLQHVVEDLAHLHDRNLGTLELQCETLLLGEWLPHILSPWGRAADEKHLHWDVNLPASFPTVQADPVRLAQVIGNLIENAIKYTPPGRSVSVTAGQEKERVWVSITDDGPGIPQEEQALIFAPFYRGGQGRRIKQGMGLGLSIARDLAEAHGGEITLESEPDHGSRFTLWLPLSSS